MAIIIAPPLLIFMAGRYSAQMALVVAAFFYPIGVAAMLVGAARGPEARGRTLESLAGRQ